MELGVSRMEIRPGLEDEVRAILEEVASGGDDAVRRLTERFDDARNENEWRDTHLRLEGPAVDGLQSAFIQDWAETGQELYSEDDEFPEQPQTGSSTVFTLNFSAWKLKNGTSVRSATATTRFSGSR